MQNSTSTSLTVVSTLEMEGLALSNEWSNICKADKRRFNKNTKADGFDTRLGKLMQKLKAEGGERISSDRLKDCNIHNIPKQRRSEALWFADNRDEALAFNKASKKGFTSLAALQQAMKKATKAKLPTPPKGDEESQETSTETNEAVTQSAKTVEDLALDILLQVEANGFKVSDFKVAINNAIGMIEDSNEAVPFEMVG
tara:strand:+ start:577 stop:1173 length:597 start_codon:yes stop_codon:yes gene_type:complete